VCRLAENENSDRRNEKYPRGHAKIEKSVYSKKEKSIIPTFNGKSMVQRFRFKV
jgi:hypothetical protein